MGCVLGESVSKDAIPGNAGVEGTDGGRATCRLADTGHAVYSCYRPFARAVGDSLLERSEG